jgi:virginiamycin B lyase
MPRVLFPLSIVCVCAVALTGAPPAAKADAKKSHPVLTPKAGVKTPGIQIPFETLKADAELAVETPGFIGIGDSIFVEDSSKDAIVRIDPKTNKLLDPILGVQKPCAGTAIAFGSLWVPSCGAQTLTRIDPKTSKVTATVSAGVADVPLGLAVTADSVWLLTDSKTTLTRIDPAANSVVGELRLPASCNSISFGEKSLWVTCPSDSRVYRVNPETNLVENRIETSAGPRSVAFLDGSVWVLCDKDGKIDRIDPKTNKVLRSVDLSVPNAGGNLIASGGFLWTTQTGFPLSRIEPMNEKERVAQQFWGEGGGAVSALANAIWLSNPSKGTVTRLDPKRVIATLAE